MAAHTPAPVSNESWIYTYIPGFLRIDGPNKYYVEKVNAIYEFLKHNLLWLKEAGGQKALLIKVPEAIVLLSKRIGPATSIPSKMINGVAQILMPLHRLGGCAKSFIAFAEVGYKYSGMFEDPEKEYKYVVKNQDQYYKAQLPYNFLEKSADKKQSFVDWSWGQWANKAQSIVDWTLSVSECGSYVWKLRHPGFDEKVPFADAIPWLGRYMSVKSLCVESWFLYQTWWKGTQFRYDEGQKKYVPIPGVLTSEYIKGSLLKISLSAVCLSLDLFQTFAPKENKPFWLETAIFWTRIAPSFITPVAMRYWPHMVTTPLYNRSPG